MKRMCKLEIKKAIKNRYFLLAVLLGCAITMLSLFYEASAQRRARENWEYVKENYGYEENPRTEIMSLYNHWIGGEMMSLGTSIYFFIFPLLAALPYGWSYCEERRNGYRRMAVVLVGRNAYFIAKYSAAFLTGALAMTTPLLLNFIMTAMLFPAVKPVVLYDVYYAVFGQSLMSGLYYSHPLLYVIFYLCIDFVYGGLLACVSFAVSSVVRHKWAVVIVPMLLCLTVHVARPLLYRRDMIGYREISPLAFLRAVPVAFDTSWSVVIAEAAILFGATALITFVWEKNREIY